MAEGKEVPGYLEEEGVPNDSRTETYVALRLEVDNWRWAGVPIYLRTGKRLARKVTEIAVTLKPVPHLAFQAEGSVGVQPNLLIMTMQPNEGVSLSLGAKIPGTRMRIRPVNMEFLYGTAFLSQSPEAYERLIMDAMRGDATLFTRDDEVEAQWRICDPILQAWATRGRPAADLPGRLGRAGGGESAARRRASLAGDLGAMVDAGAVWSEQDTTPGAIEEALRELLREQEARDAAYAPARVLNLVAVVDREWRGEILNRLERVGRYHPSRTILCAVEPGRTTIDASVVDHRRPGGAAGRVLADPRAGRAGRRPAPPGEARHDRRPARGQRHRDARVVARTATRRPSTRLLEIAQVVLVDSVNEPDRGVGGRAGRSELAQRVYVVDLAWLRSTPWRERVASTFDPPQWRPELGRIDSRDRSPPAGLLRSPACFSAAGWRRGSAGSLVRSCPPTATSTGAPTAGARTSSCG